MDTLDEQISQHKINKEYTIEEEGGSEEEENTSIQKLCRVKEELTVQKQKMDQLVETGGLLPPEERRLIELGEAIEAVEEALQYKNDLIARKQLTIAEADLDHYRNVEMLLDNMGELSRCEYKHLLGKFFLKIIELRSACHEADEMRCHFEMQASEHEKEIDDAKHVIAVMENKYERNNFELQTRYEQEIQCLMAQLRQNAASRDNGFRLDLVLFLCSFIISSGNFAVLTFSTSTQAKNVHGLDSTRKLCKNKL